MAELKEFNKDIFEELCNIQCIKTEICAVFKCDEKTLTRWCNDTYGCGFSDIYKKLSEGGKSSLRRAQWKSAMKGTTSMLIWLGKQYLNQKETPGEDELNDKLDTLIEAMQKAAEKSK